MVVQPEATEAASGFRFAKLKPPPPPALHSPCPTCTGIVRNDGVGLHDCDCVIWQELGNGVTGLAHAQVVYDTSLPFPQRAMVATIPDSEHGTVSAMRLAHGEVVTWCDGCRGSDCAACAWLWSRFIARLKEDTLPF